MILIFLKNLQNHKIQSKKALALRNVIIPPNGRQKVINAFKTGIFPKGKQRKGLTSISHLIHCVAKASDHKQLKISTPEQML